MPREPLWRRWLRPDGGAARRAIDDELRFHLEMRAREHRARGASETEARARAEARFGSVHAVARDCLAVDAGLHRRQHMKNVWTGFAHDLRTTLRALLRTPGYVTGVVLTLAVAIAANVLIFSFANAYLLRPLPFADPDRLLHLYHVDEARGWDQARFSLAQLEDWRAGVTSFEALAAYRYGYRNFGGAGTNAGAAPERVNVAQMSANAFQVLGAHAALGRTLVEGEEGPDAPAAVVLSHGLWRSRYGADPAILERSVTIDGVPHRVVGVMPERFNFPFGGVRAWTPIEEAPGERGAESYLVFGRLIPDATLARAAADVERVFGLLAAAHPLADGAYARARVVEMRQALTFVYDLLRALLMGMLATTVLVLLVAAANVAGLTLSRSLGRQRELAVRAALGAGRGRLIRQLLMEGVVLALVAAALGTLLAAAAVGGLAAAVPDDLYRVGRIQVDASALAFAALLAALTPLAFALPPALAAARRNLEATLREGTAGSGVARRTALARQGLVVSQVAVAMVLVVGAGLMVRSVAALGRVDLGFDPDDVLTLQVSPPVGAYPDADALRAYYDRVLEGVQALPAVTAAAAVYPLPLNHETMRVRVRFPGEADGASDARYGDLAAVTPDYFGVMGIDLRAGRLFTPADGPNASRVAVVGTELAQREWPGADPVGQRLVVGQGESAAEVTVVGVVDGVRHGDLERRPDPQLYRPMAQSARRSMHLVVRGSGEPTQLVGPVRAVLAEVDPALPAADVRPMRERVREAGLQWGMPALIMTVLGVAAGGLAALGVYGVIVVGVAQRRREIAVRRALGALPGDVGRAVVGQGLRLTAVGVALGLALAFAGARAGAALLYGVGPLDPLVFGGAAAGFLALSVLAGAVPVCRALRIPPQEALRGE